VRTKEADISKRVYCVVVMASSCSPLTPAPSLHGSAPFFLRRLRLLPFQNIFSRSITMKRRTTHHGNRSADLLTIFRGSILRHSKNTISIRSIIIHIRFYREATINKKRAVCETGRMKCLDSRQHSLVRTFLHHDLQFHRQNDCCYRPCLRHRPSCPSRVRVRSPLFVNHFGSWSMS